MTYILPSGQSYDPLTGGAPINWGGVNLKQQTQPVTTQISPTPQVLSLTNTNPTTRQTQTTAPVQQSSYPAEKYIGWGSAEAAADYASKQSQQAQPQQQSLNDQLQAEIDSLYSGQISALSGFEPQLKSELNTALAGVDAQKAQGQRTMATALDEANTLFSQQQQTTEQGRERALAEQRRYHNAMTQQAMSRYGIGSSAGAALFELVSQEFARQHGTIQTSYQRSLDTIFSEQTKVKNFSRDYLLKLDEDTALMARQLNDEFTRKLQEVSLQKAMLEDGRKEAKLQLLREAKAQTDKIAEYKLVHSLNLQAWEQQRDYEIKAAQQYAKDTASSLLTNQMFLSDQSTLQQSSKISPSKSADYTAQRSMFIDDKDSPWAALENPFLA